MPTILRQNIYTLHNVRTTWTVRGVSLPLTAREITIQDDPEVGDPQTLSGDRILAENRELAETGRLGVLIDRPKRIEITFPPLPNSFYFHWRNLQTFRRAFTLGIHLFDALDREPLWTPDATHYYGSCGGWKAGSVEVYQNGSLLTPGGTLEVNHAWGIVRFNVTVSNTDKVEARYVWEPRCVMIDTLNAEFKPGHRTSRSEVKAIMQELRPSHEQEGLWT